MIECMYSTIANLYHKKVQFYLKEKFQRLQSAWKSETKNQNWNTLQTNNFNSNHGNMYLHIESQNSMLFVV